ncbi:ATR [Ramazzottius varieornatus]|uniref:non-specific serine/threonine protein kinase n=1 Tax=Ramazzottius varieornatus TaxID=947166 RepID=A0A1D1WAK4_RAMVA|nr:ATR [Ramazzottius varieornatus]
MTGSRDGSPRKIAKLELQNYGNKLWTTAMPDPALLLEDEETAAQCFEKIKKDLDLSARRNPDVAEILPDFLRAVPLHTERPEAKARFLYLKAVSAWFRQQLGSFRTGDDKRQLVLLKLLHLLLRFSSKDDDLPGFAEIILEGVLSSWVIVRVQTTRCITLAYELHPVHPSEFFRRYEDILAVHLAHRLLDTPYEQKFPIMSTVITVFKFGDIEELLSTSIPFLLQPLIACGSPAAVDALTFLAEVSPLHDLSKLLFEFFEQLLPIMIVEAKDDAELEQGLRLVEKLTSKPRNKLIASDNSRLHNELLLFLCTKPEPVFKGLKFLAKAQENSVELNTQADVAKYLQGKLWSFLFFVDAKLASAHNTAKYKGNVLDSLARFITFMGVKYMSSTRTKLLASLKTAIQNLPAELLPQSFGAWKAFVETLDMASLKSILSQIAVILVPFVKTNPEFVVPIFEYFVVKNKRSLRDHFPELFFLPDIPELKEVNDTLANYINQPDIPNRFPKYLMDAVQFVDIMDRSHNATHTLSTQLTASEARRLRIPQMEVKQHALRKLRTLIRNSQGSLHQLIEESDQRATSRAGSSIAKQSDISRLISTLMDCCRDAVTNTERQRFAEVLGSIGAVDPDWVEDVESSSAASTTRWKVFSSVQDEEFAELFLRDLVKGYMTSEHTDTQNTCGVVLQQALFFYGLRDEKGPLSRQMQNSAIWQKLTPDYHEVLMPFLSSKYTVRGGGTFEYAKGPFFDSYTTFEGWIRHWTSSMIDRIDTKTATADFLKRCAVLVEDDVNRSVSLLPYIVLYLMVHCDEAFKQDLAFEITTVLESYKRPSDFHPDYQQLATQTILSLLDFLFEWSKKEDVVARCVRDEQVHISPSHATSSHCLELVQSVKRFVESVDDELLARASFSCKAYARAMFHYEKFLRLEDKSLNRWKDQKEQLEFLQSIYVALDETDGITGLNSMRTCEPSIEDQTILHLSNGNIQEALSCFEQLARLPESQFKPDNHRHVVRCLLGLDEANTALSCSNGILSEHLDWIDDLNELRIEAAWKLSQWGALENHLENEPIGQLPNKWSVGVGRLLLDCKKGDSADFQLTMGNLRAQMMAPVCAASMQKRAYHRCYDQIVDLHALQELEEGATTWFGIEPDEEMKFVVKPGAQLLAEWKTRLALAQPSYANIQKILTVRRIILEATERPELRLEIGNCWLHSAKVARQSQHLQTAYSFLLNASAYSPPELPAEQAKWLWAKGQKEQAIASLEKVVRNDSWSDLARTSPLFAKTKLLLARYYEESKSLETTEMVEKFSEVVKLMPNVEKSHFYLGQYRDKVLEGKSTKVTKEEFKVYGDQVLLVVGDFVNSLKYGCHFVHQSLPRLLTLWLDFSSLFTYEYPFKKGKDTAPKEIQEQFNNLRSIMKEGLARIPKYVFLTAMPQLISRICHPNEQAFVLLAEIIAKTTQAFPQQAMWHLAPLNLSKKKTRKDRYKRIMELVRKDQPAPLLTFLTKKEDFCSQLAVLCNIQPKGNSKTDSFSECGETRTLRRLLKEDDWLHPILPFSAFMNPILPTDGYQQKHEAFSDTLPTIREFVDKFVYMPSLMKPKKVSLIDSNGQTYTLLCKPKDDLRKDSRFMDLINIVEKFLREDAECRKRQLKIRSYFVVPLNEDCGILEWVPNVGPIRAILIQTYKDTRIDPHNPIFKTLNYNPNRPIEESIANFRKVLAAYPPVFHIWFQKKFADSMEWLTARLNFSRDVAVMSIVGYIMGLGDRHSENILIDETNGEILHVDFSCLFNNGERLEVPERVPFRLTHNIVDAMGPLGVEGFFRTACELTLKVIREQKNTMLGVLKTFVHDPLVDWQGKGTKSESGEMVNELAVANLLKIEQRITGQISGVSDSVALSVQGEVNYLIREATTERNLSRMYVGWAPYL